MIRAFVDASVFFPAVYSASGSARDLVRLSIQGKVRLVVSPDVLDETRRNLTKKAPTMLPLFQQFLALIDLETVPAPSSADVAAAEEYVVAKDAPIIAAAINAKPDYFTTYDVKDLLNPVIVAERSGLQIVTPNIVVAAVQQQLDDDVN